jgi:hypothetical protein
MAVCALLVFGLGGCGDTAALQTDETSPAPPGAVSDVVLTNLGRCVHDLIVLRGSDPAEVQVFTTSTGALDAALLGGGPVGDSGTPVYVAWAEGDLAPAELVRPGMSDEVVAEWVAAPVAAVSESVIDPSLPCPLESTGVVPADVPVDLEGLGEPAPLPLSLIAPPGPPTE